MNALIESVTKNGFCTGCGLCESIAPPGYIRMTMSSAGYLRPRVLQPLPDLATDEIAKVCPGVRVEHPPGVKNYHPIWGPIQSVQTGHAVDPEVRHQGSSGGVLSAIAIHLLESKVVSFVAQIAAARDDPLANELQLSRTRADVLRAAGSRYSPSAPLKHLRDLLGTGEKFAIIGKPCDIAALRRYAEINPAVKQQVVYMLSFMCAGIPSIKGTEQVIETLGADKSRLISFRYRGDGWPGMTRAVQSDGLAFEMDYNTSWGRILNAHLQFRCKICPDGTGEFADLVCADAWYGKGGYPDFAERDGRSLVLARTSAGLSLAREVGQLNAIQLEELAIVELGRMQPYQLDRKALVLGRNIATRLVRGVAPVYRNLGLFAASMKKSPLSWLRSAWGTYKRAGAEIQ